MDRRLTSNLIGSLIFAALISIRGIFSESIVASLTATAHDAISGSFMPTFVKAILAGWMIALMVWLLPSAKNRKNTGNPSAHVHRGDRSILAHCRRLN